MQRITILAVALAAIAITSPAASATFGEYATVSAGVNGVWLDGAGSTFPADFEAGASLSVALHERLKLIASNYYGFSNAYLRGDIGGKVVVSDKSAQDELAVYLVGKYRYGSNSKVRPDEWALGAGIGMKPFPVLAPNLTLGLEAARGVQSDVVLMYLAARWALPIQ